MRAIGRGAGDELRLTGWWFAGTMLFGLALLAYAVLALRGFGTGYGLIVAPLLLVPVLGLAHRASRLSDHLDLGGIVFCAFGVKLVAILGRYLMVTVLYRGGDSYNYHLWGLTIAPELRRLNFTFETGAPIPGTGWPNLLTGIVYAIFGTDRFVGFMVYGMLAFLGCWFFVRAFHLAVPNGDLKRFAVLVLFWPTLTFWPAATGKEAWMLFALGLTSWGVAAVLNRRPAGYLILVLGVAGSALPRPHIAIVVLAAALIGLVMGSLFGGRRQGASAGMAGRLAAVAVLLVIGAILAPKVATFLQVDDIGQSGFADSLEEVNRRTSQGGSEFTPPIISTPFDYPWAVVTVLLRPFPNEARNVSALIASGEGILLLGLLVMSIRRMVHIPVAMVQNAYAAYATAFACMFVYVFAFIANFGILSRQRAQLLPFVFVVLALAPAAERVKAKVREPARPPATRPAPLPAAPALARPRARVSA
jgi:hypothetical protein